MTASVARLSLGLALVALCASAAHAHITIAPTQSMAGATEKCTLRVAPSGCAAAWGFAALFIGEAGLLA